MITFTCSLCHYRLSVSDDAAGESGECPRCGSAYQVPSATGAAAAGGHGDPMPRSHDRARVEEEAIPFADEPVPAKPEPARVMPQGQAQARARVDEEEIPLADEPPRMAAPPRGAGGRVAATVRASDGNGGAEIPLAEETRQTVKQTAKAAPVAAASAESPPAAQVTPAGLVITAVGDATVVSFEQAKILDSLVIEAIGQELYKLVDERGCRKIALDFANVRFLSSQMLGVVMALNKKTTGAKGKLMVCGMQEELKKIFQLVRLDRIVPILPDRATAAGVLNLP